MEAVGLPAIGGDLQPLLGTFRSESGLVRVLLLVSPT